MRHAHGYVGGGSPRPAPGKGGRHVCERMGVIALPRPGRGRGGGRGRMGKVPADVFEGGGGCTGTGICRGRSC
ncbi:hypothetical protein STRTUCAR8_07204 [Streptomyces turgidiscabies Car8]|uniref:Uncharacterized protein n=1 Tax=Streptomyces turgidiscabies (strain Car8) TaxID=698760 RepID=L7F2Y3_STRT8|nr:hypothetical protein STRTUCAR8_07204 [Streptomyces turgidiscabies Car8]